MPNLLPSFYFLFFIFYFFYIMLHCFKVQEASGSASYGKNKTCKSKDKTKEMKNIIHHND